MPNGGVVILSRKVKLVLISAIVFIFVICIFLCYDRSTEFKEIANGQLNSDGSEYVYYEIVRENDLSDVYKFSADLSEYEFDFDDHSYIISFNYEIVDLSYSLISRPVFHSYDHYVPKVVLSNKNDNLCHIYEIPKVNIDIDPDDYKRNVSFDEGR